MQRIYAEWKKIISQGYILYESIYTAIDTYNNSSGIMLRQQKPISFFTGLSSRKPKSLLAEIRAAQVRMFVCSVASNSATPGTIARQAPLSMVFPRQEHWSGLPFPPPGDLPDPKMEPTPSASPALAGGFFTPEPLGKPRSPRGKTEVWLPKKLPIRSLYTAVLSQHALCMSSELLRQLLSLTLNKSWQIRIANCLRKVSNQKTEGYNKVNRKQEQTRKKKPHKIAWRRLLTYTYTNRVRDHKIHGTQGISTRRYQKGAFGEQNINLREENVISEMNKLREDWKIKPKMCTCVCAYTHICVCVCLREREAKNKEAEKRGEKRKKWKSVLPTHPGKKKLEKMRGRKPSVKLCKQKAYSNSFFMILSRVLCTVQWDFPFYLFYI